MQSYSRRQVAASFIALLGCRFHLNARSDAGPTRATTTPADSAEAPQRAKARRYRADAAILFLGMTIYRRLGVGDGEASVEESGEGPSLRRTLFFAAGSDPKRARGLSRLGWMRETVSGPEAAPSEIGYSGVLSSSPEETLDHARQSVAAPNSGRNTFAAVMGANSAGRSRSATAHFEFDAGAVWSDRALIHQAHSLFDGSVNWRETSWPDSPNQAPPTFLLQLVTLLSKRARTATGRYVYSEQEYLLTLETQQPGRGRERLLAVRGKTRNLRTGRETGFRLWLEDDSSIVPVRFEFQPRSFLRLTFEAAKS